MTRLGVALGGDPMTLAGLAGLGDVLATCMSAQSRTRWVGEQVGRGAAPADVLVGMSQVAEGVGATVVACDLAATAGVEVPVVEGVRSVFHEGRPPIEAWSALMTRRAGPEVSGA